MFKFFHNRYKAWLLKQFLKYISEIEERENYKKNCEYLIKAIKEDNKRLGLKIEDKEDDK